MGTKGSSGHSAAQYRELASQCLERVHSATTTGERIYFTEQAAVWHRLAESRQDDGASGFFTPKKAPSRGSHKQGVE